jgi:hypothetical protein
MTMRVPVTSDPRIVRLVQQGVWPSEEVVGDAVLGVGGELLTCLAREPRDQAAVVGASDTEWRGCMALGCAVAER